MLRSIVRDPVSPLDVRPVLVGLLAWIVSSIDCIPEFIPVLGPMDDAVVAVVALRYVRRRAGVAAIRARWPVSDERDGRGSAPGPLNTPRRMGRAPGDY